MRDLDRVHENRLLSRWAALLPRPATQHGSVHQTDSELVPLGDGRLLALNVDAVVEEVHTGLYDPFLAGRTAVISALSDLAAVGAEAMGVLLSVTLPGEDVERVQEEVARGARDACEAASTFVLGGDTNDGPELTVTCVAVGVVPEADVCNRIGAGAGDSLWVSGPLGAGSALAAHALLSVPAQLYGPDDYRPMPRLREGVALRGLASATMDTSDGVVATLDQLARLNEVRLVVDGPLARLLDPAAARLASARSLPPLALLAGHHGEFELVFTLPDGLESRLAEVAQGLGWSPIRLGRVQVGEGIQMAGVEIQGARLRNLLQDIGGDPRAYIAALLERTGSSA